MGVPPNPPPAPPIPLLPSWAPGRSSLSLRTAVQKGPPSTDSTYLAARTLRPSVPPPAPQISPSASSTVQKPSTLSAPPSPKANLAGRCWLWGGGAPRLCPQKGPGTPPPPAPPPPADLRKCSILQALSGGSPSSSSPPAPRAAQAQHRGMLSGRAVHGTLCRQRGAGGAGGGMGGEFGVRSPAMGCWGGVAGSLGP